MSMATDNDFNKFSHAFEKYRLSTPQPTFEGFVDSVWNDKSHDDCQNFLTKLANAVTNKQQKEIRSVQQTSSVQQISPVQQGPIKLDLTGLYQNNKLITPNLRESIRMALICTFQGEPIWVRIGRNNLNPFDPHMYRSGGTGQLMYMEYLQRLDSDGFTLKKLAEELLSNSQRPIGRRILNELSAYL